MNMINRKQMYTNQTHSRWKKVNKMTYVTVIADLIVEQKQIYHADLSFSAYFIPIYVSFIIVKNCGFVMEFVILAIHFLLKTTKNY